MPDVELIAQFGIGNVEAIAALLHTAAHDKAAAVPKWVPTANDRLNWVLTVIRCSDGAQLSRCQVGAATKNAGNFRGSTYM